jgi:hypothetical protein
MFSVFTTGSTSNCSFLMKELINLGVSLQGYQYTRKEHTVQETNTLVDEFSKAQADIFIFTKEEQLTRSLLLKLKKVSPRTKFIMWYGDQRGYIVPEIIKERKNLLSALLITNADRQQFKIYNNFGISNVFSFYHAFSPEEFFPRPEVKEKYTVFFGGNNFKHGKFPLSKFRLDFITEVNKKFKTVVYGAGWPFGAKQAVSRPDYAKVICSAKLNLGVNHYDVVRYYDRRLFESMATGKLHITRYIPGMEKDFVNHKNIVWFNSIEEGIDQIGYYLKNDKERSKIGAQAACLMHKYHAWNTRAIQFVNIVKTIL